MPFEASEREEQYFQEQELKRRMQQAAEQQAKLAEDEKRRLKELHWMHCPKCGQTLATEKYGTVDIDVCPTCKGLWLDATELDQILASTQKTGPLRSFLKILGK
jgi:acetyl-CoA carboxylase beta subunit